MANDDPRLPVFAGIYWWRYPIDLDEDGRDFTLTFHHCGAEVGGSWWLDIADATGTTLIAGLKLSLGRDKLRRYQHDPRFPRGVLAVVDTDGSGLDPGPTDLGTRVVVTYALAPE